MSAKKVISSNAAQTPAQSSPIPMTLLNSNKKRVLSIEVEVKPQAKAIAKFEINKKPSTFRLMDLPAELRLRIYEYVLPTGPRLYLDEENIGIPSPHAEDVSLGATVRYGDMASMMSVSHKMHTEVCEFIYTRNMINVIKPLEMGDFLIDRGTEALPFITKLECHLTSGIGDLGHIWNTMSLCPKLSSMRLIFYHEKKQWSKTLAQLAHYACFDGELELEVELHTSVIFSRHRPDAETYQTEFQNHFRLADTYSNVFAFVLPKPLRKITIAASVTAEAAYGFATLEEDGIPWRWMKRSNTDTPGMKTLRWEENSKWNVAGDDEEAECGLSERGEVAADK